MTSSKKILAENIRALIDRSGLTVRGWAISNKLDQPPHLAITETELKLYARLKELSGR